MACWEPGHDEPWFVLTDLAPNQSEALWYGMRAWIENGFKLLKHAGWQWQLTRMTDPDRASRVLVGIGCRDSLQGGRGDIPA